MTRVARCIGTFLIAALVASTLHAQDSSIEQTPSKYPWDMRPMKCFLDPQQPQVGSCKAPEAWPDFVTTKRRVDQLLAAQEIGLLDKAGRELGLSELQFPSGDYYFEAWSLAFESVFAHPTEHDFKLAKRWTDASGGSGFSRFAEAYLLYGDAWIARGSGMANTVSPEAWKLYHRKLEEANAVLDSAPDDVRASGPWHALKLRIVMEHPALRAQRAATLNAAVDLWPDSVAIYMERIRFAAPKWGGSFEEVDSIIRLAVDESRQKWGDAMYARLYERVFRGAGEFTLADSAVDWKLMKKGIRDFESRTSGHTWMWRNFAQLACQMRDREEAARLYVIYDQARGDQPAERVDSCREFVKDGRI